MATAVRLALGAASVLVLARFAYGLLVPAMQGDLGRTLVDAGALSTAKGVGYVVGVVLTAALVRRWGAASVFRWGMATTAVTMAGTAASTSSWCWWRRAPWPERRGLRCSSRVA